MSEANGFLLSLLWGCADNVCWRVSYYMEVLMLTKEDLSSLREAVDLKLASLRRAQKSATPVFAVVYDQVISEHSDLLLRLEKELGHAPAAGKKG